MFKLSDIFILLAVMVSFVISAYLWFNGFKDHGVFTDSRGSVSSNQRLSEARAASVLEYLADLGVDRARLESHGYGEERPLDPREVPEAWEKNRRVDFFVAARDDDGDGKPDEPAPE